MTKLNALYGSTRRSKVLISLKAPRLPVVTSTAQELSTVETTTKQIVKTVSAARQVTRPAIVPVVVVEWCYT